MIPKPSWLTEEPDKWPDDAREFYRLCHAILKRARAQKSMILLGQAGKVASGEEGK